MGRKSLTFFVVVAASITLSLILTTAPLNGAQPDDAKKNPNSQSKPEKGEAQRAPVVSPPDPSPYTGEQSRQYNEDYLAIQRQLTEYSRSLAIDTFRLAQYTETLTKIGWAVGGLELLILALQVVYAGRAANAEKLSGSLLANNFGGDTLHEFIDFNGVPSVVSENGLHTAHERDS